MLLLDVCDITTLMLCVAYSWNVAGHQITVIGMTTVTSAAPCRCLQSCTVLCRCPVVQCTAMFIVVFAWGPLA